MNSRNNIVAIHEAQPTTATEAEPVCEHDAYPRYAPGEYEALCVGGRIYWNPLIRANTCELKFQLLWPAGAAFPSGDSQPISAFFHMGREEKPKAGRRSRYHFAWVVANGAPPRRGQRLSLSAFKGKNFRARVGDVTRRADGTAHHPAEVYSTVKDILEKTVG